MRTPHPICEKFEPCWLWGSGLLVRAREFRAVLSDPFGLELSVGVGGQGRRSNSIGFDRAFIPQVSSFPPAQSFSSPLWNLLTISSPIGRIIIHQCSSTRQLTQEEHRPTWNGVCPLFSSCLTTWSEGSSGPPSLLAPCSPTRPLIASSWSEAKRRQIIMRTIHIVLEQQNFGDPPFLDLNQKR